MTSSELAEYELKRMEFNAYKVAEEVAFRIDGAPAPGGYLKAYAAGPPDNLFFMTRNF